MSDFRHTLPDAGAYAAPAAARNRVLRNTYWLLAVSLLRQIW